MKKLLLWWKNYQKERKNKYLRDCACRRYDVSVYCNEIWLFHDNSPICPINMFTKGDNPSDIVQTLRELYVLKNKNE
jgi:hypothetical protein